MSLNMTVDEFKEKCKDIGEFVEEARAALDDEDDNREVIELAGVQRNGDILIAKDTCIPSNLHVGKIQRLVWLVDVFDQFINGSMDPPPPAPPFDPMS